MTPTRPILYRNGSVYSAADPFATAMLVDGDTVAWIGSEHAAESLADATMTVVDLAGALITPGFVDSHVHTTETGLALESIDLSSCTGITDLLDRVAAAARTGVSTVLGHGWDESRWPERMVPTAGQLDAAGGGKHVYLARADVHSAVVSGSLAAALDLANLDGWDNGFVVRDAHVTARLASRDLADGERSAYQSAALRRAAANGIVAVAEMGAPHISPVADLQALLRIGQDPLGEQLPEILPYWGQPVTSVTELQEVLDLFGGSLAGIGGDLNVDGSLGSRTAALREPYADDVHRGSVFLQADTVAAHLGAATSIGMQAGFHVIGDAGLDVVLQGLALAADAHGIEAVRRARHRLEHVELADAEAIARLVHFGVTVSAQPAFDARWGAAGGLYSQRLGAARMTGMNPFASFLAAGVPLCFGSDSPVTSLNPWATLRASVMHNNPAQRISARAAFIAHTRAGWRAVGTGHPLLGQLVPGAPASYAVWEVEELMVQTADSRVQSWSTDPRAGTPLLPALDTGADPVCLETVHRGRQLFQAPGFNEISSPLRSVS
ncbi:amidohydrolase family protein [Arthrobacter sp. Bz4]|uniref:amidohydrolase n=1 Tax=Arthrobacter sp. Bz4 TaxID=2171979 RepID=UPI000D50F8DD|nr:amidohydrolase family protein [Arthrobacter sp. Bz4]PVE19893.1 amidohydrolase [Arthrobacter sp. Bz4]